MISPQSRPLPRHADEYFERQASDLSGLSDSMQSVVRRARRARRGLPRILHPVISTLVFVLIFCLFVCEEVEIWWKQLDWQAELRVLTFAVWTLVAMIVGLMLFDLLLTYNSAGMVR